MSTLFKNQKGFAILGYLFAVAISIYSLISNQKQIISLFQDILVNTPPKLQLAQVSGSTNITSGLVGYWSMDTADIDWNNNTIIDRSGNGNKGMLMGLTQASNSVAGKIGEAMKFEDAGDYINIPSSANLNLSLAEGLTYASWIRIDVAPTNWTPIISNTSQNLSIYKGGLLLFRPGGTIPQLVAYLVPTLPTNKVGEWFHVVATYDGAKISFYLNGAPLTCSSCSAAVSGVFPSTNSYKIAGSVTPLNGAIDDLRVYNRALSASEIAELYNTTSFETPDLTAPVTPQGLTSTSKTSNSVNLSWNANSESNLTSYKVYKDSSEVAVVDNSVTSHEVSGLSAGTTYSFAISAINSSNVESPRSSTISVTTDGTTEVQNSGTPTRLQVSGSLSPDATGIYELVATSCKNLPAWKRMDGQYYIQYENSSILYITTSADPCNYNKRMWTWAYKTITNTEVYSSQTASGMTGTAAVNTLANPGFAYPADYIQSLNRPSFKSGHTLLPLTQFGWGLSFRTFKELAHWGYAIDIQDTDDSMIAKLSDPNSVQSRIIALVQSNPSLYKLAIHVPRVPKEMIPDSVYARDANGNKTSTWSPIAPDSALTNMATYLANNIKIVQQKVPISIILNGGERYLGVCGWDCTVWGKDPDIIATKGTEDWNSFASRKKAHQEMFFTNAIRSVTPATYIWYSAGGNPGRAQSCSQWRSWDWDYLHMHPIHDYPGTEAYWKEGNTGFTGHLNMTGCLGTSNQDMLSRVLNAYGYAQKFGSDKKLSYNWVTSGFRSSRGDINTYYGFLKSYYVSGMIGGVAGSFAYPEGGFDAVFDINNPPDWLLQILALGQVHAEFSYLEDMLRNGELLPGQDMMPQSPDQPAYEFRTGYNDTRVLARKMNGKKRWLISAWAADGVQRSVTVDIPTLGIVNVTAKSVGTLYDARIVNGVKTVTSLDGGSKTPTPLNVPISVPDADDASVTAGDSSAPMITILGSTAPLSSDTSSVPLQLTTNEEATCKWGKTANTAYASIPNTFTKSANTHTSTITNLVSGANNIYIRCQDITGNSNTTDTLVTITVSAAPPSVNTPPILSPIGSKSVDENSTLTFTILATDTDGDILTYFASSTLPAGATFNNSTRVFTWKPTFSQSGVYSQTFLVSDGNGGVDSETINITVNNINRAPQAFAGNDQIITLPANANLSASASSDPDADNLSYSWTKVSGPISTISSPNTVSTNVSFTTQGTYVYRLTVSDGTLNSTDDISITVNPQSVIVTDSDNDGVPDVSDKCPNTKLGRIVNRVGCPLPKISKFTLKTDLSSVDINSISSFELGNSYGKVSWNNTSSPFSLIRSDEPLDIDSNLIITTNTINLNSQLLPELNKNSTVTIYNVNVSRPRIMKDGQICTSCTIISHQNNTVTFTVPGFSIYTVIEEYIPLPVVVPEAFRTSRSTSNSSQIVIQPVTPTIIKPSTTVKPVVKTKLPTTSPTPAVVYTDLVLDGGSIEPFKTLSFKELLIQYLKKILYKTNRFFEDFISRIYSGFQKVI